MLFLRRLLQVVLVLMLVRLLLRAVAAFVRGLQQSRGPAQPKPEPAALSTDLVRDRICNTFVPRERALVARVGGREEHFCSAGCRDKALLLSQAS